MNRRGLSFINQQRISELQLSIRGGNGRLASRGQKGKVAILRSIENAKIRIECLQKGLPEGGMVFKDGRWMYEHENINGLIKNNDQ
jgi:hypothetical protein